MIDQNLEGTYNEPVLGLVETAFADVHLDRDAFEVVARGRRLQRRKRAVPALGALGVLAASTSLAFALTGPSGPAGTAAAKSGRTLASGGTVVDVNEASFSVHTDAKTGIITLSLNEYAVDEGELKQVLAQAGVRTVFDATCMGPGIKELSLHGVISEDGWPDPGAYAFPVGTSPTVTINPFTMPRGSVLAFQSSALPSSRGGEVHVLTNVALYSGEPTGACAPR